ncbi:MAG: ABC transporter substrate-binding (seleno)protein SaoB [Lachnospiraceae bacterium]
MNINKTIIIAMTGFLTLGLGCAFIFPKEAPKNEKAVVKMGAGDDISGLLMKEIKTRMQGNNKCATTVEESSFMDCCSNSAQWALNAKEINVGFYCNHIAKHTVEHNKNVMIYAPAVMNAEVIGYQGDWSQVKKLGMTQGRKQSKIIAKKQYPQIMSFEEITQKGIMYCMEDGQVDGAILDITKAAGVPMYSYQPLSQNDYISYVLVVDKQFVQTKAFSEFRKTYNEAVKVLNQKDYLAEQLEVEPSWLEQKKIKFLTLPEE